MRQISNVSMQTILNIPAALISLSTTYPGTPIIITNEATMWAIKMSFGGCVEHPITHDIIEMIVDPSVPRTLPDDTPYILYVYGEEKQAEFRSKIEQVIQYEQAAAGTQLLKRSLTNDKCVHNLDCLS